MKWLCDSLLAVKSPSSLQRELAIPFDISCMALHVMANPLLLSQLYLFVGVFFAWTP